MAVDYGLDPVQVEVLWSRWRQGESISSIARAVGRPQQHLRRHLAHSGGMRPPVPRAPAAHLSSGEREEISRGIAAGLSSRGIAASLGRPGSTVSREIARHGGRGTYRAQAAHEQAGVNRRRPKAAKLAAVPRLRAVVEAWLGLRWSPDQIASRLPLVFPEDLGMRVSDESIYRCIYDPRLHAINRSLFRRLRRGRPMRYPRKRRHHCGRGRIKGMTSIRDRPAEVQDRGVAGHWEGDLVMGRRRCAVATPLERTSRYTVLIALPDGYSSDAVAPHLIAGLEAIPKHLARSLTWDRGREMACHQQVSAATGMPVYSCNPSSPWQRGSNENTNGLLRQYLGESADLRSFTEGDLNTIAAELNDRPRRVHGYRSAAEVYNTLAHTLETPVVR